MKKKRKSNYDNVITATEEYIDPSMVYSNKEDIEEVKKNIKKNGLWGWCEVQVKVIHEDTQLYGMDEESHCSYKDEEDFKNNTAYYKEMVENALTDLQIAIDSLQDENVPKFEDFK